MKSGGHTQQQWESFFVDTIAQYNKWCDTKKKGDQVSRCVVQILKVK